MSTRFEVLRRSLWEQEWSKTANLNIGGQVKSVIYLNKSFRRCSMRGICYYKYMHLVDSIGSGAEGEKELFITPETKKKKKKKNEH